MWVQGSTAGYTAPLRFKFMSTQGTSLYNESFFPPCYRAHGVNSTDTVTPDSNGRSYLWFECLK